MRKLVGPIPRLGVSMLLGAWAVAGLAPKAAAQEGHKVYQVSELDKNPGFKTPRVAAEKIRGAFQEAYRARKSGGSVLLEFIVSDNGKVVPESVTIVAATYDALGEAVKAVLPNIDFNPGMAGGSAVCSQVKLPFEFRP